MGGGDQGAACLLHVFSVGIGIFFPRPLCIVWREGGRSLGRKCFAYFESFFVCVLLLLCGCRYGRLGGRCRRCRDGEVCYDMYRSQGIAIYRQVNDNRAEHANRASNGNAWRIRRTCLRSPSARCNDRRRECRYGRHSSSGGRRAAFLRNNCRNLSN